MIRNLPANAGDTGLIPDLGGFHVPWGNYDCVLRLLSPRVWSLCSATREATQWEVHASQRGGSRHSLQLEKAPSQQQRPSATKNNLKIKIFLKRDLIKLITCTTSITGIVKGTWFFYLVISISLLQLNGSNWLTQFGVTASAQAKMSAVLPALLL